LFTVGVAMAMLGGVAWSCTGRVLPEASLGPSDKESTTPAPSQISAASITEIATERRCMGCEREFKLTLKPDGTATRTLFGNARGGTSDRQFTAAATPAAFEELARAIVAEGFFQLKDEYRDPQVADGEFTVTTVTTTAGHKSVLDSNAAAPEALRRIQARIEDLGTTLTWKPAPQ
jgi:hypothetical protein